ncbi:hypothetical protein D9M70_632960 [compost metagenome]
MVERVQEDELGVSFHKNHLLRQRELNDVVIRRLHEELRCVRWELVKPRLLTSLSKQDGLAQIEPSGDQAAVSRDEKLLVLGLSDSLDKLVHRRVAQVVLRLLQEQDIQPTFDAFST